MTGHPDSATSLFSTAAPEFRVFISSAFGDTPHLLEHLIRNVFPDLRNMCRQRGVRFAEFNSRDFGGDISGGKTIDECLDELDRQRPLFVGIFGASNDGADDADGNGHTTAHALAGLGRSTAGDREQSLREMEIIEGALKKLVIADRMYFYFCESQEGVAESDGDIGARFARMKERIRRSGATVRQALPGLPEIGESIREDLRVAIEQRFPLGDPGLQLERERRLHEAYAVSRRHVYVEDPAIIRRLDEYALAGDGPPVVISGEPGVGKSALIAHWSEHFRARFPQAFLIPYYIGGVMSGGNHLQLLVRIMKEIRLRFGILHEIPTRSGDIEHQFPTWLEYIRDEPLALAIDALNQLDEPSRSLAWLPAYLPPKVRLIVSTQEGGVLEELRGRNWREIPLRPLSQDDRAMLVRRVLGSDGTAISDRQLRRVSDDPASANPLALRMLLEELRVRSTADDLNEDIEYYLKAHTLEEFFELLLEKLEGRFGEDLVRRMFSLLWGARTGLARDDLYELLECDGGELDALLAALRNKLIDQEGRLSFFHEQMRFGVERRYLHGEGGARQWHLKIASYYESKVVSQHTADELPWQLTQACAWKRLANCLCDPDLFRLFHASNRLYELLGHWLAIGRRYPLVDMYLRRVAIHEQRSPDRMEIARLKWQIGEFLMMGGHLDGAGQLLREALEICRDHPDADDLDIAGIMNNLGALHAERKQTEQAEELLRGALEIYEHRVGSENVATLACLDNLLTLAHSMGDIGKAEIIARRALDIRLGTLGEAHIDTLTSFENLGAIFYSHGAFEMAEPYFGKALRLAESHLGDHPVTASNLNNLGVCLMRQNHTDEALRYFRRAVAIATATLGAGHQETASYMNNLGYLLKDRGHYGEAEKLYRQAIEIDSARLGADHPKLAGHHINLASLYRAMDRLDEALWHVWQAIEIRERAFGADHGESATAGLNLASLYYRMGRSREALHAYGMYLPIAMRHLGREHEDVRVALNRYSDLNGTIGGGPDLGT